MAKAQAGKGGQRKKKWSKGKVRDKSNHSVMVNDDLYNRIIKEVPTFKFISQAILIERLKINGSLARLAIKHLEKEGLIKKTVRHHAQIIYTRVTGGGAAAAE